MRITLNSPSIPYRSGLSPCTAPDGPPDPGSCAVLRVSTARAAAATALRPVQPQEYQRSWYNTGVLTLPEQLRSSYNARRTKHGGGDRNAPRR
eukprot:3531093-Rhodomonas_salina.1